MQSYLVRTNLIDSLIDFKIYIYIYIYIYDALEVCSLPRSLCSRIYGYFSMDNPAPHKKYMINGNMMSHHVIIAAMHQT